MKPNIILVLLDGARWDRISINPKFEELRKEGSLLNNVTAAIPYTMGAINVLFSGLYGKENGVDGYNKINGLKNSVKILSEILKVNGYSTVYHILHEKVISKRGFDLCLILDEYKDNGSIEHSNTLTKSFEHTGNKPVFTFLQFGGIHTMTTLEVLNKYNWDDLNFYKNKEKNIERYDESINEALIYAKKIKGIVEQLENTRDTILIFFSDHGTGLGERFGERSYGTFTYEETIRTFQLFIGKKILKNKIYSKLRSSIDFLPTILDLCEIKYDVDLPGKSFAKALIYANVELNESMYAYSETGSKHGPHPSLEKPNVFCIKTLRYKLIYFQATNKFELYDLINDPLEKNNLFLKNLAIEKKLKDKLLRWINR